MTDIDHTIILNNEYPNSANIHIHCDSEQVHLIVYRYSVVIALDEDGCPTIEVRDIDMKGENKELLFSHNSATLEDGWGDD